MLTSWPKNRLVWLIIVGLLIGLSGTLAGCDQASEDPSKEIVPEVFDSTEPNRAAQPLPDQAEAGEVAVDTVEVQIQETTPEQVQVVASGNLKDGCTQIADREVKRVENGFQVRLTAQRLADQMCTEALVPYEEVVRLDVTDLPAGEYTVEVNGKTESFTLGEEKASQEPAFSSQEEAQAFYTDEAKEALAQQQSVDPAEIQVERVEPIAGNEAVYSIKLRLDDKVYEYHGTEGEVLTVSDPLPAAPIEQEMGIKSYYDLVEGLQSLSQVTVQPVDEAPQPPQPVFSAPAQLIMVNDHEVWVYEYQDQISAEAEAKRISPDGSEIEASEGAGPAMVDWADTPHFYQEGRILVLYLGNEVRVLEALQIVLGPQVAGGEVPNSTAGSDG